MLFARQILYKNFFYFLRFGIRDSPVATDEDAKKKARLAKFASVSKTDPLEEEKRKARTIRFVSRPTVNCHPLFPFIDIYMFLIVYN